MCMKKLNCILYVQLPFLRMYTNLRLIKIKRVELKYMLLYFYAILKLNTLPLSNLGNKLPLIACPIKIYWVWSLLKNAIFSSKIPEKMVRGHTVQENARAADMWSYVLGIENAEGSCIENSMNCASMRFILVTRLMRLSIFFSDVIYLDVFLCEK